MGKEKFMKDFNGEKMFSLEYDKETLKDMVLEKQEEIERLNKRIEDLNIINEEHRVLNGMIRKELQQKETIIKEVREYVDKWENIARYELLEMLDKGSDKA